MTSIITRVRGGFYFSKMQTELKKPKKSCILTILFYKKVKNYKIESQNNEITETGLHSFRMCVFMPTEQIAPFFPCQKVGRLNQENELLAAIIIRCD